MQIRRENHFNRVLKCFADRPPNIAALIPTTDTPALVDAHHHLTYAQLDHRVASLTAGLISLDIAPGDRIATLIGNRIEFVEIALACARLGAIFVPLGTRQKRPELAFALTQSGAKILFHEPDFAPELPDHPTIPIDSDAYRNLMTHEPRSLPPVLEQHPFAILYTSGTTGQPKGAVLTHLGVIHSCLHYKHAMRLGPHDRAILAVPAAHVTGLVGIILATLATGGCLHMMPSFKARAFLERAERERITTALMVPAMYNLCLLDPEFDRFDLSAWRVCAFGGAPMPQATAERLKSKNPSLVMMNAYGATETTSPAALLPEDAGDHLDCVGQVVACDDILIMDEHGNEVPPGEPGELWIAGPNVIPHYWQNPAADAASFAGPYWKSGDIGAIDAEGFLRVFDRKKDMINRAGYKVYPAEVESVLAYHPAITEAAIIGYPDPVLGEKTHAFIVADPETTDADIRHFCAARLADYKIPDRITFVEELPRNSNGKLLKSVLRTLT